MKQTNFSAHVLLRALPPRWWRCTKQTRVTASLLLAAMMLAACSRQQAAIGYFTTIYSPEYASGFEILGSEGAQSTIIVTKAAWQGADSTASTSLLIARGGEIAPKGFTGQVMQGDARRIVCMSSTHIAMLDAVGQAEMVVGVSGLDYVSNPTVQSRRDMVADIGFEGSVDYERLVSLSPDLVLLYGVSGANTMEPKLNELGIPYMYVGEYLEESPLGKAEWMVAVAEAIGLRSQASETFAPIPAKYNELKQLVADIPSKPTVMLNTPYGDQWMMPSNKSYSARLITDAGGCLAYNRDTANQSHPIDLEQAYMLAAGSDTWIGVGQISSFDQLKQLLPKFADVKPIKSGQVWNCNLRSTQAGGNDYWESGVTNPHLVLQDLIMILHPGIITDGVFTYYKRLD